MVTVIATKEELTTPVNNGGVTGGGSCDNERSFQFIKDYQEVDFHRSPSCKPLPEDLFEINNGQISKSSIKGTFFVQIDTIEPSIQISNNQNNYDHILLTLTDGILTVKAITNDSIPNLTFNTKSGSKLLLTDLIPIQNGLLQLTHDNTRFQYGSNTYPRPRSIYRGRGNGSYRPSYEGRRNSRYDNDDGESNLLKRPPPKNTLMDFMTSLKISNDNENEKGKERYDNNNNNNKRQYNGNSLNNDQIIYQQDGIDEQLNPEDDPSHANYRERRNPLPPRLQRAQEERSRRNTNRYYDESISSTNDINSIYRNDTTNNQSLSSTSYIRRADQPTYIPNNSSVPINSYPQSTNILTTMNGSTPTHLAYFQTNPNSLTYISNPSYHNQPPTLIGHSYSNEHFNFCCGIPYTTNSTYLPTNINGDSKNNGNIYSDNENLVSQNDENNDSGIKSETSSNEQKSTPPLLNDSNTNFQEEKRRDSNSNPRPRWKIGDMCLARWSEDGEFYYATIMEIQPPYCTVLFRDYNNYDQIHFNDLKIIPRDQQFYSFIPPPTDLNILAANGYFSPRTNYYTPTIDGCIIMPEAPPFPFNSAGTLYMYPPPSLTTISPSNDYQQYIQQNENEDLIINSSSSPSKDSNDASAIDSTSTSNDDNHQQQEFPLPQPCSIADAPLTLITSEDDNHQDDFPLPQPCSIADAPLTLITSEIDNHQDDSSSQSCSIADLPLTLTTSEVDNHQDDFSPPQPCSIADAPLTLITSEDDNHQDDFSLPRPCSIADAPLTLITSEVDNHQNDISSSQACSIADTPLTLVTSDDLCEDNVRKKVKLMDNN